MTATTSGYIAIQFKGVTTDDGWLPTGSNLTTEQLPISTTASEAPPSRASYAPVRRFGARLDREYEGTFSGNGPRSPIRADHRNLMVEKLSDAVSGNLLEYLCTGKQLAWVHVVRLGEYGNLQMKLSMQDVQVVDFSFEATRQMGEEVDPGTGIWGPYAHRLLRLDRYTLLYLTLQITTYFSEEAGAPSAAVARGWHTGNDAAL